MKDIGEYIRKAREHKKMNITKLAKEAGISRPYLSQIESGDRKPSPEILEKLSQPLDVDYIELLFLAGYVDEDFYLKSIEVNRAADVANDLFVNKLNDPKLTDQQKEKFFSVYETTKSILKTEAKMRSLDLPTKLSHYHYYYNRKTAIESELEKTSDTNLIQKLDEEIIFLDDFKETLDESNSDLFKNPLDLMQILSHPINISFNGKLLDEKTKVKILHIIDVLIDDED